MVMAPRSRVTGTKFHASLMDSPQALTGHVHIGINMKDIAASTSPNVKVAASRSEAAGL